MLVFMALSFPLGVFWGHHLAKPRAECKPMCKISEISKITAISETLVMPRQWFLREVNATLNYRTRIFKLSDPYQ
jgi:hypothetical protein